MLAPMAARRLGFGRRTARGEVRVCGKIEEAARLSYLQGRSVDSEGVTGSAARRRDWREARSSPPAVAKIFALPTPIPRVPDGEAGRRHREAGHRRQHSRRRNPGSTPAASTAATPVEH